MKKIVIICIYMCFVPFSVHSMELMETLESLGVYDISSTESEIFTELDYNELVFQIKNGQGVNVDKIIHIIAEYFVKQLTVHYKVFLSIVITGFAVSLVNTLKIDNKAIYETSFSVSYAIYASVLIFSFIKCIQPAEEMLETLFVMVKTSLPLLISLLTISGGTTTASLISASLMAMVEVLNYVINLFVLPLIVSSVTVSVANNMSDKINIGAMVNFMRQSAKWILGFCLAIYTGFYGVYGVVGPSLDNRIGKAARFAIGRGIPVVGGVVSESIESVMSVMGAVRDVTGVIGIVSICIIGLTPIIKTVIYMLAFKLASVVLEPVSDNRIITLTSETAEAISLIMSVLVASCLLFVGCIGILLMAGNFLN